MITLSMRLAAKGMERMRFVMALERMQRELTPQHWALMPRLMQRALRPQVLALKRLVNSLSLWVNLPLR